MTCIYIYALRGVGLRVTFQSEKERGAALSAYG